MATEIRILFHPKGTPQTRKPVLEVVFFRASGVTRLFLMPCSRKFWATWGAHKAVGGIELALKTYERILDDED